MSDEDGIETVAVFFPVTRRGPGGWRNIRVWENVNGLPGVQVHYDNGIGWPGRVRVKRPSGNWSYHNGSVDIVDGYPRSRIISLDRTSYDIARLVTAAYHDAPIKRVRGGVDVVQALHVVAREIDKEPNNAATNLYPGSHAENMADDVGRAGRPRVGKHRAFRGRPEGVDEWTFFESPTEAVEKIGVTSGTISDALFLGYRTGRAKWELEWIPMELGDGVEKKLIDADAKRGGLRFLTSDGRVGQFKTTRRGGETQTVPVEIFMKPVQSGYLVMDVAGKPERVHRLMMWLFRREEIEAYARQGIPWDKLQVDHVNRKRTDNRLENLRIVTIQKHREKDCDEVIEVDANGVRIGPESWVSFNSAARAAEIPSGSIHRACMSNGTKPVSNKTTRIQRYFMLKKCYGTEVLPTTKRKRTDSTPATT